MLAELFGTVAAPLIFIGLVALGALVTVLVAAVVNSPAQRLPDRDTQPERREDSPVSQNGLTEDSGLPKII